MAPTVYKLMVLLGICLAAADVAEAGAKVITTMRLPDEKFTSDLQNSTTDAYKNLTARIEKDIGDALKAKTSDIISLKVNGYTNGSVVLNATVELAATVDASKTDTAQLVKNATTAVATNSSFTAFKIDSASITTKAESTSATTTAAAGATTTAAAGATTTAAAGATTTAAPGGTTAAASGSNTTTAGSGTTTAASGTTTAAAAGSGSNTTTAASGSGSNTTTAASGSGTTTAAAAGSGSGTTTAAATGTNTTASGTNTPPSGTNTPAPGTSGSGSGTGGAAAGSTGTSTGTGTSTSSTQNTTARIPVKVDETSLGGMGVIITVSKNSLPSVAPYLDITKPEYGNLMGAIPALNNMLKGTSEADKILGNIELKQVIPEDSASIRVEYVVTVAKETTLAPLQAAMDALNKKDVFKIDGTTHRVEFVPLTVPYRWHSLKLRLSNKAFAAEMKDPSYAQFKGLQTEIQGPLTDLLRARVPAVRALYIQEFTSGSVLVRASVETDNTSTNATSNSLSNALSTVENIGTYNVDPNANSKSVTGEQYIYGAHTVQPVPESQLPARTPLPRDTENIKKGQVTLEDGSVKQEPIKRNNYFFTVTIPSFVAVLILIIIFLCCTTSDSCLCKICSNDPKNVP